MKILLCIALTFASAYSYAQEYTITKSVSPGLINVRPGITGLALFSVRLNELPSGLLRSMTIKEFNWSTTYYPYENLNETVELCYLPYGYSKTHVEMCEPISPNATGRLDKFVSLRFGYESRVIIRHRVSGERRPVHPQGNDTISIKFSD